MSKHVPLSGRESSFGEGEIIVSKTDTRGIITYVNDVFVRVSGFTEEELIGAPHNLIRHPRMPRGVFRLLWETVKSGEELFAYVLNRSKNGDEYWVYAHVTPSLDRQGRHVGYHSNRRRPYPDALPAVKRLYAQMIEEEARYRTASEAAAAGLAFLNQTLEAEGATYPEFVFSLSKHTTLVGSAG